MALYKKLSNTSRVFNLRVLSYISNRMSTVALGHEKSIKPASSLPGPGSLPLVGSMPFLLLDKNWDLTHIHKYWQMAFLKYGPIFKITLPGIGKMAVIESAEDTEAVYRHTMEYPTRIEFGSLRHARQHHMDEYFKGTYGISFENGEEWWRIRSRIQGPLLSTKKLAHYVPVIDQIALEFIDRIVETRDDKRELPKDFFHQLSRFTLEAMGYVAFDKRLHCFDQKSGAGEDIEVIIKSVGDMLAAMSKTELGARMWRYYPTKAYKVLVNGQKAFIEVAEKLMSEAKESLKDRKKEGEELSILETLLEDPGLTEVDVATTMLDMFFAGTETTASSLGFALYLLAKHPEKQALIRQEADRVLGAGTEPVTYNRMAEAHYVRMFVKEAFRHFPVIPGLSRILQSDLELAGYNIPKGWIVLIMNMLTGWDEKVFRNAGEFVPERWGRDRPLGPIHPFGSLPFGYGRRKCVGRRIAEQEMYILILRMAQRFNVEYHHPEMTIFTKLLTSPEIPLKLRLIER